MNKRRIWEISRAGSLDRLRLRDDVLPDPGPEEVVVASRASGLNFADIFACLGLYSATPPGAFIPGLEFAGEVIATGSKVKKFKKKQKVMGVTRFGGYASHVCVDQRALLGLPAGWTFEEGAALLAQGLTAYYALFELGALRKGGLVLVHSAAGGVGLLALEMLQKFGATAIATVGNPGKIALLKERYNLDDQQILVRSSTSRQFQQQLKRAIDYTGQPGLDLVLDSIMGPYFWPAYRALQPAGRLVLFGAADWMPSGRRPNYLKLAWSYLQRPRLDPLAMISENKSLMAFNLIWLWDRILDLEPMARSMLQMKLRPPHVGHRFAFEQAPDALRLFQSGSTAGKVVLQLN